MRNRLLLIAIVAIIAYLWWNHESAVVVLSAPPDVNLPTVPVSDAPLQRDISNGPVFKVNGYELHALATYSATARVLSTERYSFGVEADLSPLDVALGWGRMAKPEVINKLTISQGGRFYQWRYSNAPPIPFDEIVQSSANTHIIPASAEVTRALAHVSTGANGDIISLKGYLVEATKPDGWHWRSSLTRQDSGDHACELLYVQSASLE